MAHDNDCQRASVDLPVKLYLKAKTYYFTWYRSIHRLNVSDEWCERVDICTNFSIGSDRTGRFPCDEHTMELVIVRKRMEFGIRVPISRRQAAGGEVRYHAHIYWIVFPTMSDASAGNEANGNLFNIVNRHSFGHFGYTVKRSYYRNVHSSVISVPVHAFSQRCSIIPFRLNDFHLQNLK